MSGQELNYIQRAFDENYISSIGSNLPEFEERIRRFTGAEHVLAVINGTAALHLALRIGGVTHGDEVFASTFTFIGSIAPIMYQGATPVFLESDEASWNLSPHVLKEAIADYKQNQKPLPKALVITHLYGQCADIEVIADICNEEGILLIEDAAESLGATCNNKHSGTFGDFGVYSFNGNKILTTSGGGVLVAKNPEHLKQAQFLSTQAKEPAPHYQHETYGYNYRMSNILAGLGIAQMDVLNDRIIARKKIFETYKMHLKELNFMPELAHAQGNRWLTTVLFKDYTTRERIRLALESHNIESRPLWKPMHLQPLYEKNPYYGDQTSSTLFDKGLCLPSGSSLESHDLMRIISIIQKELHV